MLKLSHTIKTMLSAAGLFLVANEAAMAQTAQCRQLERQLANASSSTSGATRSLQNAVRQQKRELSKANKIARNYGCSKNASRTGCATRIDLVRRMENNLISLERQLRQFGGADKNQHRAIKRRMEQLRCRGSVSEVKLNSRDKNSALLEQIFGVKNVQENGGSSSVYVPRSNNSGLYRTMCVRSCDGYYFPISFSTTRSYFDQDADACAARCPIAETELYYHSMPGASVEDMVSWPSSTPYKEQSFAFIYRTKKVENCSCGRASFDQLQEIAGSGQLPNDQIKDAAENQIVQKRSYIPLPNWRPNITLSPHAINAQQGGLTLQAASNFISKKPNSGDQIASNGKQEKRVIRLVGPKFFPDQ